MRSLRCFRSDVLLSELPMEPVVGPPGVKGAERVWSADSLIENVASWLLITTLCVLLPIVWVNCDRLDTDHGRSEFRRLPRITTRPAAETLPGDTASICPVGKGSAEPPITSVEVAWEFELASPPWRQVATESARPSDVSESRAAISRSLSVYSPEASQSVVGTDEGGFMATSIGWCSSHSCPGKNFRKTNYRGELNCFPRKFRLFAYKKFNLTTFSLVIFVVNCNKKLKICIYIKK